METNRQRDAADWWKEDEGNDDEPADDLFSNIMATPIAEQAKSGMSEWVQLEVDSSADFTQSSLKIVCSPEGSYSRVTFSGSIRQPHTDEHILWIPRQIGLDLLR